MGRIIAVILILLAVTSCSADHVSNEEAFTLKEEGHDAVVCDVLADIYRSAYAGSARMTQALYNQPVDIIRESGDFYYIRTYGNVKGYIIKSKVSRDISSLKTNSRDEKILITGDSKTIYANPDGEVPLEKVTAGTVLSYRGKKGDWVCVALCGGEEGYLTMNNLILYEGHIPVTDAGSFERDIIRFSDSKFMYGGISLLEGFDMTNLVNLCARMNGIDLPVDIDELAAAGEAVGIDEIMDGDILFLSKDRYNDDIISVAVAVSQDRVVFYSEEGYAVTIGRMADEDIRNRIRQVRRIFGENG